jgi:hypothetical protein
MPPTIEEIQNRLNKLYWTDSVKYMEHLNMIKGMGYKVYRNPKGIHKVEMDMSTAFGGIFNEIFNSK